MTGDAGAAMDRGDDGPGKEEVGIDMDIDGNAPPCCNACAKQAGGSTTTPPSLRVDGRLGICVTLNLSSNVVLPTPGAPTTKTFNCDGAR
jgi:hypothetical protein